jgi:GlpG protein
MESLFRGDLWRVITPAFLHGSPLHLIMNMMGLASLGRLTERIEGIYKYAVLLIVFALGSHLLQGLLPPSLGGTPNFVGISGVVFGLFGYLAIKSWLRPRIGFSFPPQAYLMIGLMFLIGFSGGTNLANLAHVGGFVAGVLMGFAWNR